MLLRKHPCINRLCLSNIYTIDYLIGETTQFLIWHEQTDCAEQMVQGSTLFFEFIICMIIMHETPFTLLVRRDRQKKIMAKTNIVEMTEKIKAINCIAKNAETTNSPASNSSAKEKYAILLCNSVRKSRLFRKILNRSTEHRLTTQECE